MRLLVFSSSLFMVNDLVHLCSKHQLQLQHQHANHQHKHRVNTETWLRLIKCWLRPYNTEESPPAVHENDHRFTMLLASFSDPEALSL